MILALLIQAATPAVCPTPAPPPPALAGWATPVASPGALIVGQAARVRLTGQAVRRAMPAPGRPAAKGTTGTVLDVTVAAGGTYRVALDSALWIDVVRAGKPLTSVAHAHGPACSGIRKMVDFRLEPGSYRIQLSGGTAPVARVMVARLG